MSAGDVDEIASELRGRAQSLELLCSWDNACRGMEWPNIIEIAKLCSSVGDLAHRALHGTYDEQRRFRSEYTRHPELAAIRLLGQAAEVETTLFQQVMSLSPPRVVDDWLPGYLALNPDLAVRAKHAGLG
jgi:hypothetical protein